MEFEKIKFEFATAYAEEIYNALMAIIEIEYIRLEQFVESAPDWNSKLGGNVNLVNFLTNQKHNAYIVAKQYEKVELSQFVSVGDDDDDDEDDITKVH